MSLFNEASLYISPNGVKAGKLYALKGADLDVVRATDGSYVGSNGVIQYALPNVPRLDYSNSTCPSILVEPQRTNLLTYSEDFTSTRGWVSSVNTTSTATLTANYGVAPDGTNTADRIQLALNSGTYADWLMVKNVLTIGQTYTYSIYLKSLTSNCSLYFLSGGFTGNILKNVTTQWVKHSYTFTATGTNLVPRFLIEGASSTSVDILAWGMQLELGSNATSYIKTEATTVTRNADVITDSTITGIATITETFEDNTTNVITSPTSYTMSNGRIKSVVGV